MKRVFAFLVTISLVGLVSESFAAPPSSEEPKGYVSLIDDANAELFEKGKTLDERLRKIVAIFNDRRQKRNLESLRPQAQQISVAALAANRLGRIAAELTDRGEPLASDFGVRASYYYSVISACGAEMANSPGFPYSNILEKSRILNEQFLGSPRRRIEQLLAAKRPFDAENEAYRLREALDLVDFWCFQREPQKTADRRLQANRIISSAAAAASEVRKLETRSRLEGLRAESMPDFEGLITRLNAAPEGLAAGPAANWDGENRTGPDIIREATKEWLQQFRKASRVAAIDVRITITAFKENETEDLTQKANEFRAYQSDHVSRVLAAMAALIPADAGDLDAPAIPALYADYVDAIAPLGSVLQVEDWMEPFRGPLDQLASKNPQLKSDIDAYRTATTELMAWRRQVSNRKGGNRRVVIGDAYGHSSQAFMSAMSSNGNSPESISIAAPSNMLVSSMREFLVEQPMAASMVRTHLRFADVLKPIDNENPPAFGFSALNRRTLGRVSGFSPNLWAEPAKRVRADLMVTPTTKPLTMEAASAAWSVEHGFFDFVGCVPRGFSFDSKVSTDSQVSIEEELFSPLVRLNDIPGATLGSNFNAAVISFDFDPPSWLLHDQFFYEVSKEEEL